MGTREELLADWSLTGSDLCAALSDQSDTWLRELFGAAVGEAGHGGVALVAVGGYGRRELSPMSDLDVVLVHRPRVDVAAIAERLWYPIWDSGQKLGHAVRTLPEAIALADTDLDTATSLLDCRHLAGDTNLATELAEQASSRWRRRARRRLGELARSVQQRHERAGEVAFLLEPDLKDGRGGLRDLHALRWAHAARQILFDEDLELLVGSYRTILAARVELHRRTGRPGDRLLLEEQDAVAAALGHADANDLMRSIATAARSIAWHSDETWMRVEATLAGPPGRALRRDRVVAPGVVIREGTVTLTASADFDDPVLPLRVGAIAATAGAPVERGAVDRLTRCPPMPAPWPDEARTRLVELFLAGRAAIPVVESFDHHGIWTTILPEWSAVRCLPQRNAYHRFTVDRHLLETAVNAASLTDRVDRPDLLVVGALLHDIGKGHAGDHTEVGIEIVSDLAPRLGFGPRDTADLVAMVRHHLLLPDVATRRDLSDEGTLRHVADAVGSLRVLRLLDALTEADSLATGPAAWGDWKAGLVRDLVARAAHLLAGGELDDILPDDFPSSADRNLMASGQRHVGTGPDVVTVVDADTPGLFSTIAGVLALNGVGVLAASAWSEDGRAIARVHVARPSGEPVDWEPVLADLDAARAGALVIDDRLTQRARSTRRLAVKTAAPIADSVVVDNEISDAATVVEVHTLDRPGVLYRITRAFAGLDLDIRSARVQTLGPAVVDSFYLCDRDGAKIDSREATLLLRSAILAALGEVARPPGSARHR